jgi:hypothetical protein
MKFRPFFTSP